MRCGGLTALLCAVALPMGALAACDPAHNITIGGPLSISEGDAYYSIGMNIYNVLQWWQQWVNEDHGGVDVNGVKHCVNLIVNEDNSNKAQVQAIVEELIVDDNVDFLFAPYSSDLTDAAAAVADQYGKLMVSSGSATASVFEDKRHLFGALTPASSLLAPMINTIAGRGAATIGYIYEDLTYTTEVCGAIPKVIEDSGLKLTTTKVVELPPGPSESMLRDALDEFDGEAPDIFVSCTYFDACIYSLHLMEEMAFQPEAKIFTLCATDSSFQEEAGSNGIYTLTATNWDRSMPYRDEFLNWTASDFADEYQARYNANTAYQGAATFAIMTALIRAIESADSLNADAVAYWLSRSQAATFYGPLEFDSQNMNNAETAFVQAFEDLQAAVVSPKEIATAELAYPLSCVNVYGVDSCHCQPNGCRSCTPDDYLVQYEACDEWSNSRAVTVQKLETSDCIDIEDYDPSLRIPCEYSTINSSAGATIVILSATTIVCSVAGIIWVFVHRKRKLVMASQPTFLALFCLGVGMLGATMIFFLGEAVERKCALRVWLGGMGFTVAFGALTLKVFRVFRIFGNATLTRVRVREQDVLKGLAGLVLLDIVLLFLYTFIEPPSVYDEDYYVNKDLVLVSEPQCKYLTGTVITIYIATKAVLLLYGLYLSFKTRNVDARFERSSMIMLAMYQYALAIIIFMLIDYTANLSLWEYQLMFCALLAFASLTSLCFIILPKVLKYHSGDSDLDERQKSGVTPSSTYSRRFNRTEMTEFMMHSIDDKKSTLTYQQYMDLVFSPADIIDMNDRITALESENVLLKRELAMTHNQVFRLREQLEQDNTPSASSAPTSTLNPAPSTVMRGFERFARSVRETIQRASESTIRSTKVEI